MPVCPQPFTLAACADTRLLDKKRWLKSAEHIRTAVGMEDNRQDRDLVMRAQDRPEGGGE